MSEEKSRRQAPKPGAKHAFDWLIVGLVLSAVVIVVAARHVGFYSVPERGTPVSSLQVDIERPAGTLDPRFNSGAISARIDELVYASLVRVDPHGNFAGELAQSFEWPTPTTIVFHLRRGLLFSDGRPLLARDVKYTYDSILDPANHSPKRMTLHALVSISAPNASTVVMKTAQPYGPAMEMATIGVVPYGTPPPDKDTKREPAASGPFRIAHFARGGPVVLARNPYHGNAQGKVGEIVFKVVPNPTVRALELIQGVCDLAENNLPPGLLGYFATRPDLVVDKTPGSRYFRLVFNFRNPHLRDLRVRLAIAYALNRKRIVSSHYKGDGRVATGMLSPENWAYSGNVTKYHFDGVKVLSLLDKAGYTAAANGIRKLSFVYETTPEGEKLGKTIKKMLRRAGIRVEIHTDKPAAFRNAIRQGKFGLFSSQWDGINDPREYYSLLDSKMVPPQGYNSGAYSNPAMDRLLEADSAALGRAARRKIYARVQALAASNLPTVPLWWLDNIVVLNRRVKGFIPYPNGSLRSLSNVSLAQPTNHAR